MNIQEWGDTEELERIEGVLGYHHKFVENYAQIVLVEEGLF